MKRAFTILTAVLLTATVWAQSPEKMSYQAVIRNSSNQLVTSTAVGIQISILQGSPDGTAVYVETQTPITNANGLVSIEIGGGTVVSGDFTTINWANGHYFIKTETDLAGGTSYTITGTSQLLSVPFALHAKTAESVSGSINETDPIYTASQAANITAGDITNLSNLSGTNTGDQDLSHLATKTALGDSTALVRSEIPDVSSFATQSALEDTASAIRNNIPTVNTYSVGDFAHGGIVFWVDETGQHGLVCTKTDQSTGVRWYAGTSGYTQANGDGPYAGEANTSIIIAAQVAIGDDNSTYAARICNELQITEGGKTYGDWYLPSKAELNLMYQNKATIGATAAANGGSAFASANYWSSTEYNNNNAWKQNFNNGNQNNNNKNNTNYVRAVRGFKQKYFTMSGIRPALF